MAVIIISSSTDPASTNIKNSLLKNTSWEKIDLFYNNPVFKNCVKMCPTGALVFRKEHVT